MPKWWQNVRCVSVCFMGRRTQFLIRCSSFTVNPNVRSNHAVNDVSVESIVDHSVLSFQTRVKTPRFTVFQLRSKNQKPSYRTHRKRAHSHPTHPCLCASTFCREMYSASMHAKQDTDSLASLLVNYMYKCFNKLERLGIVRYN